MQREQKFKPGDRVLVEMLFHGVWHERASIQFMPEGMPFCVDWGRVHPIPTEAQTLRAAALIGRRKGLADMEGMEVLADRLEAASAPKPPSLREAVEKAAAQFDYYEKQHRAKGTPDADAKAETNRALAAEMRAALTAEPEESKS